MNLAADDEVGGNHTDGEEDEVRGSITQNKQNIGLTEQEIKKQTLDKSDIGVASSNLKFNAKFKGPSSSNFDFTDLESRNHNFRESIQKEETNEREIESNAQEDAET